MRIIVSVPLWNPKVFIEMMFVNFWLICVYLYLLYLIRCLCLNYAQNNVQFVQQKYQNIKNGLEAIDI
jgi:hypothetical protein